MQKLGKGDHVLCTYVGKGHRHLHETTTGFQFGTGEDSQLVTNVSQVSEFNEDVRAKVAHWLDQDGVRKAEKSKREFVIAEEAAILPGTLDAKVRQFGPSFYADLLATIDRAIEKQGGPDSQGISNGSQSVDGGIVVDRENGTREYIPQDALDDPLYNQRKRQASPKITFVTKDSHSLEGGEGVDAESESGSFSGEIQKVLEINSPPIGKKSVGVKGQKRK